MKILGIETSCDETAAAVVEDGRHVLSNTIYSQIAKHRPYGGVVPEIASRNHVAKLPGIIDEALDAAHESYASIDALAVTYGPGLASSLLIGFTAAKTLAQRLNIPLIRVNHHEGHLHSVFMREDAPAAEDVFPMLGLMVSGGDTSLVLLSETGKYEVIGSTIDDAAGEALDKAAAVLQSLLPSHGLPWACISKQGNRSPALTRRAIRCAFRILFRRLHHQPGKTRTTHLQASFLIFDGAGRVRVFLGL